MLLLPNKWDRARHQLKRARVTITAANKGLGVAAVDTSTYVPKALDRLALFLFSNSSRYCVQLDRCSSSRY